MIDAVEDALILLLIVGGSLALLTYAVLWGWNQLGEYLSDLDGVFTA